MLGVSRSATLIIAYIIQTMSLTVTQAFNFVVQLRDCVSPNPFYIYQLKRFESQIVNFTQLGTKLNYSCKICYRELFGFDSLMVHYDEDENCLKCKFIVKKMS